MKMKWMVMGLLFLGISKMDAAVLGYWRFENNLSDSSGAGHSASGGVGYGYSASVPGTEINPGSLTNLSSYQPGTTPVSIAASEPLNDAFALGSFTVEAFVYLNAGADNFQTVLSNYNTSAGLYFTVGTTMSSYAAGINGNGVDSGGTFGTGLDTGIWYHVAWVGTYQADNGTAMQFFVNGAAVGAPVFLAANGPVHITMPESQPWTVGGPANNFNGLIDELRISNEALAPSQFLTAVPEPGTYALFGIGFLALVLPRCAASFKGRFLCRQS